MIERCTSNWKHEAPADLTVRLHLGTNMNSLLKHFKTINVMGRK